MDEQSGTEGATETEGGTYVVKSGDSLSAIAEEQLGDANRWQEIYDANREAIGDDPDHIQAGTELTIPA